ncbi:TlpA disulfide reductase family protein [Subsaximicrobium wynnwilliamsii]|nr:TlpA disulfide reductase family protein [Subsaximicrobium wynnwilliamsii]
MKKLFFFLSLGAMVCSCNTELKTPIEGYRVVGETPGVYNGIRVYLHVLDQKGRQRSIDTAIVLNERFTFEGSLKGPQYVELTVNSIKGTLPLILIPEEVRLTIDSNDVGNSNISSSNANDALKTYNQTISAIDDEYNTLAQQLNKQSTSNDADPDVVSQKLAQIKARKDAYPYEFIKANTDNYYSLILINEMLWKRKMEVNKLEQSYAALGKDITASDFGQEVNRRIAATKAAIAPLMATEIGQQAPNFTAPTPEGTSFKLYDNLGKVTIVDFWAAWCGPCRRENPNVVKVYDKYHDKGLEIVGVSLDGNRRQQDPKAAWIKAIKDDKLTWHQVSNLNYFNDPVAKAYAIQSIPATFILDANGKIIAKNLRGASLERKIAELLD